MSPSPVLDLATVAALYCHLSDNNPAEGDAFTEGWVAALDAVRVYAERRHGLDAVARAIALYRDYDGLPTWKVVWSNGEEIYVKAADKPSALNSAYDRLGGTRASVIYCAIYG